MGRKPKPHPQRHGIKIGAIPYGSSLAENLSDLVPNAAEQEVMASARALVAKHYSLREVSAILAEQGKFNRAGHRFSPSQIRRMVSSPS